MVAVWGQRGCCVRTGSVRQTTWPRRWKQRSPFDCRAHCWRIANLRCDGTWQVFHQWAPGDPRVKSAASFDL